MRGVTLVVVDVVTVEGNPPPPSLPVDMMVVVTGW